MNWVFRPDSLGNHFMCYIHNREHCVTRVPKVNNKPTIFFRKQHVHKKDT